MKLIIVGLEIPIIWTDVPRLLFTIKVENLSCPTAFYRIGLVASWAGSND